MRQQQWLELTTDYDLEILYRSGKANVVTDALSHKRQLSVASMLTKQKELIKDLRWSEVEVVFGDVEARLASVVSGLKKYLSWVISGRRKV